MGSKQVTVGGTDQQPQSSQTSSWYAAIAAALVAAVPLVGHAQGSAPAGTPSAEAGPHIQFVKLESTLTRDEIIEIALRRKPEFVKVDGLLQKYYVELGVPNSYGGIYIWANKEAMLAFRKSELAAGIGKEYRVVDQPRVEVMKLVFELRNSASK
jgi:hypothetical protein